MSNKRVKQKVEIQQAETIKCSNQYEYNEQQKSEVESSNTIKQRQ
jgi:hypothetical protein